MESRWKTRLDQLGRANDEARRAELRRLTPERVRVLMEGLLSHPLVQPRPDAHHPVSLSRRMRPRE